MFNIIEKKITTYLKTLEVRKNILRMQGQLFLNQNIYWRKK